MENFCPSIISKALATIHAVTPEPQENATVEFLLIFIFSNFFLSSSLDKKHLLIGSIHSIHGKLKLLGIDPLFISGRGSFSVPLNLPLLLASTNSNFLLLIFSLI